MLGMENCYQLVYYQCFSSCSHIFVLFIPAFIFSPFFTHLVTYSLIIFILIKFFNVWQGFNFIIVSAGLLPLLIHLVSAISLFLYNYCRYIRLTINHFSYSILSLTKQLYKKFKLVQRVINSHLSYRIFLIVILITALVSNLWAILYSLNAKILYITHLHLINNQQRILALFLSISTTTKPI